MSEAIDQGACEKSPTAVSRKGTHGEGLCRDTSESGTTRNSIGNAAESRAATIPPLSLTPNNSILEATYNVATLIGIGTIFELNITPRPISETPQDALATIIPISGLAVVRPTNAPPATLSGPTADEASSRAWQIAQHSSAPRRHQR